MNKPDLEQKKPPAPAGTGKTYDPELLYVECRFCGRPILWAPGRTTHLLVQSDINPLTLDEHCLILSEGCRECMPESEGFHMSIVRLAKAPLAAMLMLRSPAGHA
ncbi:MAG: hypothetical protein LBD82_06565 [Deltaproteobacteria bacterium]|jgi:hypothetical protein|nr:hypothetical protein [Deltaproteobacteria bacterium]